MRSVPVILASIRWMTIVASLLGSTGVITVWGRSTSRSDGVFLGLHGRPVLITTFIGGVECVTMAPSQQSRPSPLLTIICGSDVYGTVGHFTGMGGVTGPRTVPWRWLGFNAVSGFFGDGFDVPFWFLLLASMTVPTVVFIRAVRRRRLADATRCAACGYDLRASRARCPECGLAINAGDPTAQRSA